MKNERIQRSRRPSTARWTAIIAICLLCIVTAELRAGDAQSPIRLTLDGAITLALEQNRDVLVAGQERYKAEAQIGEARSGVFPQIDIFGNYTRNLKKPVLFLPPDNPFNTSGSTVAFEIGSDNAYAAGASFSQTLFSRKLGMAMAIASTYSDYTEQGFHATEESVTLDVRKAFYLVLLAQKLVEANRQGLDVVRANFESVQSQYRHGVAAEFDMLRAEVQLANTEPLVVSAENNLALAVNNLKTLLSIPLDQEVLIEGDLSIQEMPREAMDEARKAALTANPSMIQLSLQETLLEQNISIENANFWPILSLVGSYQWQTQDNTFRFRNYNWAQLFSLGVQLSYPLFDGFKTSSRVEQASVDREMLHYVRLKTEEGLKLRIQSAELKMAEARERIAGQEKNIDQARKAVGIAQTRYKNGVGTQLELLDAQVAMTRAQTNYAQASYDYLVAAAEWKFAVGSHR